MKRGDLLHYENNRTWRLVQHLDGPHWLAHVLVDEAARLRGVSPPLHEINVSYMEFSDGTGAAVEEASE
jgi:hypothetical protein